MCCNGKTNIVFLNEHYSDANTIFFVEDIKEIVEGVCSVPPDKMINVVIIYFLTQLLAAC